MFVLKNKKTGQYIALDAASGGYPYDVRLEEAKRFNTLADAESYNAVMSWKDYDNPLYSVEMLSISATPVFSASGKALEARRDHRRSS